MKLLHQVNKKKTKRNKEINVWLKNKERIANKGYMQ